jgi:hypothetical protein
MCGVMLRNLVEKGRGASKLLMMLLLELREAFLCPPVQPCMIEQANRALPHRFAHVSKNDDVAAVHRKE